MIYIQWFHTAIKGMISQMTSSFSSKLLQTPPPSSKWWVISYYNTTNAFIGMHSLCLWGSGLILAETREDPFTLYASSTFFFFIQSNNFAIKSVSCCSCHLRDVWITANILDLLEICCHRRLLLLFLSPSSSFFIQCHKLSLKPMSCFSCHLKDI